MQIGFIGLGAVVETAYLPALRRPGTSSTAAVAMTDCSRALPIQRCSSLSALLAEPTDTLFITTSSLQHLPVLERALASGISRIVVEKPIVANLEQAARLRALLAPTEQAARVLALDHWMARGVALNARPAVAGGRRPAACLRRTCQRRISSGSKVICRSQAALTALVSRSHSILPPGSWIPGSCVILMG